MSGNKFHINPELGPRPCGAKKGDCPYRDELHYNSMEAAQAVYETLMVGEYGSLSSVKRKGNNSRRGFFTKELLEVEKNFEENACDYDYVLNYANESPENQKKLDELIVARAQKTADQHRRLEQLDPHNPNVKIPIMVKNYNGLKKELRGYSDDTATLVDAYLNSEHYSTIVKDISPDILGRAVKSTAYPQTDPRWYSSRLNTVGGSDVGAMVMKDFVPEDELDGFQKLKIKNVEESKLIPLTKEDLERRVAARTADNRNGAAYRGSMWEDRIRDEFADDHPEMTVYNCKQQYESPDAPWQYVNVDGVISDREDGAPNGILEIKTSSDPESWADGVPINYRAQTLYYLHVTGYKYAYVRALINDGEKKDYKISADDDVFPGSFVKMDEYIETKLEPWFKSIVAQRESQKDDS